MIIRKGMTVALVGIAAGLLGAFALTRAMAGLLYDVQPTDPVTFTIVAFVLATVIALRYE